MLNHDNEQWWYQGTAKAMKSDFGLTLDSIEPVFLSKMFRELGNQSFMRHNAQSFDQAPLVNAYRKEDEKFIMNVKCVFQSSVPKSANTILKHTIYKLKVSANSPFKL